MQAKIDQLTAEKDALVASEAAWKEKEAHWKKDEDKLVGELDWFRHVLHQLCEFKRQIQKGRARRLRLRLVLQ